MVIEFEKIRKKSTFLDPRRGFEESSLPIEMRKDPLTKRTCTLLEFRLKMPEKPDLSKMVDKSLGKCPFCPESIKKTTPKFSEELISEGRINLEEAWVVPNLMPYSEYSAITIISKEHFVEMGDFTEEMLSNAFMASQIYLRRASECDRRLKYFFVNWNYMPPSGGSVIHPHLQVFAPDLPTKYQKMILEASEKYHNEQKSNFWDDLIKRERKLGERYIGAVGRTHWVMSFTSRSMMFEVMAVIQGKESILSMLDSDIKDLSTGIRRVLQYLSDQNFYSFNLTIYSGSVGQDYFWTNARIVPRFTLPPLGISDVASARMLHDMLFCVRRPEEVCKELREYF